MIIKILDSILKCWIDVEFYTELCKIMELKSDKLID